MGKCYNFNNKITRRGRIICMICLRKSGANPELILLYEILNA